ncbi:hypothetical protein [Nitrosomonas marina]|uniref:Lipoprotein n=1 Tax=Nitrosomonas marina TaxID=917 RepID=A0A1H8GR79_9PROT|nr:hypothetical protein [Nitrosomonas marina]SEN46224.1 hypothetical protein SAMN05216325_11923 [Nitrosomonas marina]
MKYSLFSGVLIAIFLVACNEKPGQYPPSLYKEREGMLSNEGLESSKQKTAEEKKSFTLAENQSAYNETTSEPAADTKDSWGVISEKISKESDSTDDVEPSLSEVDDDESDSWGVISDEISK